jgi:hypothetical protein
LPARGYQVPVHEQGAKGILQTADEDTSPFAAAIFRIKRHQTALVESSKDATGTGIRILFKDLNRDLHLNSKRGFTAELKTVFAPRFDN